MTSKVKTEVNRLLTSSQHNKLAAAIVGNSSTGVLATTMREQMFAVIRGCDSKVKGKPLNAADVDAIADQAESMYRKQGLKPVSIKVQISNVKKLARCAPVLATMDRNALAIACRSLDSMRVFCTLLQKSNFNVAKTVRAAKAPRKAEAVSPDKRVMQLAKQIAKMKGIKSAQAREVLNAVRNALGV